MSHPAAALTLRAALLVSRTRTEEQRDLRDAQQAFERFTALEAAHDPALVDMYADEGAVIERWFENGAEKPARELSLRRYKQMLREALAVAAKAGESSRHLSVSFHHVAPGCVLARSLRDYSHSRAIAPYEAMLRRQPDGSWRVSKEVATLVL